ncbi:uncharacterized protein N7483_000625 [Penicillium malachiteum]|uniref:uncharacterized protein n=1 Tax=Penicillium malachiteum TaxID=1324776 RepID=UPI002549622B|nr:uncharacterized protein N7483_000625 [Penicillium malachiteum]KAJ5735500.1 hypothetical protein N7483_000625 [Penicillium malachiteum]
MYAKNCLAFLATSWFLLQSVPVAADEIVNLDSKQLNERKLAAAAASGDSGSCQAPSASTSPTIASVVTPSSTAAICPLASALCAACPVTTSTVTVSSCPTGTAGGTGSPTSSTCEGGCGAGATSSSTKAGESSTISSSNPSSSQIASSTPVSSSPIQTSTPLVPSTRSSTPLIPSGRTSTPAESGSTLQTLPTSTAASGPGAGVSTPAGGGAVTPRAAIPPGIVRRQLMGVMNVTAPFANTSSILTNATSTFNMTSFRTTSTTEAGSGFRFHMRNRY